MNRPLAQGQVRLAGEDEEQHRECEIGDWKLRRWSTGDLFVLAWRGSQVKSNAPCLNRNNGYLYRLAHYFGSNWRECSRRPK